jgi:hypothetical protein
MTEEQEIMWERLKKPPMPLTTENIEFNDTGTIMTIDRFGNGLEIDTFNLSTPWDINTASYKHTITVGM